MKERTTKEIIRDNLLAYQGEEGLSVQELADRIGISRNTLGFWLRADRAPSAENLADIRKATGKSIDFLLGLAPSPATDPKIRDICEYTGLSEESVKALHLYKEGLKANAEYETYEDCIANTERLQRNPECEQFDYHTKEIQLVPNLNALEAISMILETDYHLHMDHDHYEIYEDNTPCRSIFDEVHKVIFPQKYDTDENNPEYASFIEYQAEKKLKDYILYLRTLYNKEYGADGTQYREEKQRSIIRKAILADASARAYNGEEYHTFSEGQIKEEE